MADLWKQASENGPLLAQQAVEFLKPHFVATMGKVTDQALERTGNSVGKLWSWLKSKLSRPEHKVALQKAAEAPAAEQTWDDIRTQISLALERDAGLKSELANLLRELGWKGETKLVSEQSGNANVNVQIIGSKNSTNITR